MSWSPSELDEVIKALAVVCEVTGTTFSSGARGFIMRELEKHNSKQVLSALERCASNCKTRLTLGAIVHELDHVDRKKLSDERASRSAYLTQLRGLALVENIPWEAGEDEVHRRLLEKGYKLGAPWPKKEIKSLPHWTEDHDA